MNFRTRRLLINIAMLIVVAALALVVLFDLPGGDVAQQPATAHITERSLENVRRIVVEPADGPHIVLERRDGGWMLIEPVEVEAGPARILQLGDLLTAESRGRFAPDSVDPATSGLDRPALIVRFDETVIALGKTNPLTQRRYVQVDGGDVHVIDETRAAFIAPHHAAYVSPILLPTGTALDAIEIDGRLIERDPEGIWRIKAGPALDGPAIIALVEAWQGATALSAESIGPAGERPQAPRDEAVLHLADGRALHFAIAARAPEVILDRPDIGIRYRLPDLFAAGLFPETDD